MDERSPDLKAYRFRYKGTEARAETFEFYQKNIVGWLRVHRGDAVWIQGAYIGREAYMIMTLDAAKYFENMMGRVTGGKWIIEPITIDTINILITEIDERGRRTKGYLHSGNIEIGDPDQNFCPEQKWHEVSIREECGSGGEYRSKCPYWNGWRCTWTWEKAHGWTKPKEYRQFVRELIDKGAAENFVAERKKHGDLNKYVIVPTTDTPTGETAYRIYRVVLQ